MDCTACDWQVVEPDPDTWDIWELWFLVQTQWRVGMGGPTGLDYASVLSTAAMADIEVTPRLWNGIRLLERITLQESSRNE